MEPQLNVANIDAYMHIRYDNQTSVISIARRNDTSHTLQAVVDAWAIWLAQVLSHWPKEKPIQIVHDMRSSKLTQYAFTKSRETLQHLPQDLQGRYAVVRVNNPVGRMLTLHINHVASRAVKGIDVRLFYKPEKAVAWVQDFRPASLQSTD